MICRMVPKNSAGVCFQKPHPNSIQTFLNTKNHVSFVSYMMSVLCNTNWLPEFGKPFCGTAGSPKQQASFKICVKPYNHIPGKHTIVFHHVMQLILDLGLPPLLPGPAMVLSVMPQSS